MYVSLDRIILYVQDVERLANFYKDAFALPVVEEISGEWAVLRVGACELALHRVGKPYRVADAASWKVETNAKLVISVRRELNELRAELIRKGVPMGPLKSYPGLTGPLCDGTDPEGNVFQLAQVQ
jgi:catechol-2,3-dioxygenase